MTGFDSLIADLGNPQKLSVFAKAVSLGEGEDLPSIDFLFSEFSPEKSHWIKFGEGPNEKVISLWIRGCVLLIWVGLSSISQVVEAYLKSNQSPAIAAPGGCISFASEIAEEGTAAIVSDLASAASHFGLSGVDLFLVGHSGGASFNLAFLSQLPPNLAHLIKKKQVVSFAAPRTYSPSLVGGMSFNHIRISINGDVVPRVPPMVWTSNYPPFLNIPLTPLFYQHHGYGFNLEEDGSLVPSDDDLPSLDLGYFKIASGSLATLLDPSLHSIDEILFRLLKGKKSSTAQVSGSLNSSSVLSILGVTAMPLYKVTYLFEQGPWGWSESHVIPATSVDAALTIVSTPGIWQSRCDLLGGTSSSGAFNPILASIRVSSTTLQRNTRILRLNQKAIWFTSSPADIPNTAILCNLSGNDASGNPISYTRNLYMRGNPDEIVTDGGIYSNTGVWQTKWNAWSNVMQNNGFGFMASAKGGNYYLIKSAVNQGTNLEVTLYNSPDYPSGSLLEITESQPSGILNGKYKIVNVAPDKFLILNKNVIGSVSWFGTVNSRTPIFVPYNRFQIVRATHRDTGRPSSSPRGRQPTR